MSAIVPRFNYLSILRAPRPFIMIRFIRIFLKFSMPKNRINQIFKYVRTCIDFLHHWMTKICTVICVACRRSGQQIYNVTLFFLFFMSLYSLLGVQLFGELNNHCILNTTDTKWVTLDKIVFECHVTHSGSETSQAFWRQFLSLLYMYTEFLIANNYNYRLRHKNLHITDRYCTYAEGARGMWSGLPTLRIFP